MTPEQQTALVAERLPRAVRNAAGLEHTILSKKELAELAGEAGELMHHINGVGLVILPVEYFSAYPEGMTDEKEISIKSQNRQGLRAVPIPGTTKEPACLDPVDSGVCTSRDDSRKEVSGLGGLEEYYANPDGTQKPHREPNE